MTLMVDIESYITTLEFFSGISRLAKRMWLCSVLEREKKAIGWITKNIPV
jgi:hypothetical protein